MGATAEMATRGISVRFLLLGIIGLLIAFLPSILAVLKGTFNKGQVIKNQLILTVINVLIAGVFFVLTAVLAIGLPKMIFVIVGGLWALVSVILWFYILACTLKDAQIRLF